MHTTAKTPQLEIEQGTLVRYLVTITALGIAVLTVPAVMGIETSPFLLVNQYVLMLGGAMLAARRTGPGGVRRLFSGLLHWRVGWRNWAIALVAMPVVTLAIALATGTFVAPAEGWTNLVTDYLYTTFIFGGLFLNLAEETFWVGFVQRNLARRHGLLRGALLTAVPFAAIHIPLTFAQSSSARMTLIGIAALVLVAPIMRYVLGRNDFVTGGSLATAIVFHAGFNATGKLSAVDGEWQYAIALVVIALGLLLDDTVRSRSGQKRLYAQDAGVPGGAQAVGASR